MTTHDQKWVMKVFEDNPRLYHLVSEQVQTRLLRDDSAYQH